MNNLQKSDGTYFDLQESHLSYGFELLQSSETDKGMGIFVFNVDFFSDKKGSVTIEAKTLKIALEMLEAVARETKELNSKEFEAFKNKFSKSTLYVSVLHHRGENGEEKTDILRIFKPNRTRDGLESFKRGEEEQKHSLSAALLKEVDELTAERSPQHKNRHGSIDDHSEEEEEVSPLEFNLRLHQEE